MQVLLLSETFYCPNEGIESVDGVEIPVRVSGLHSPSVTQESAEKSLINISMLSNPNSYE